MNGKEIRNAGWAVLLAGITILPLVGGCGVSREDHDTLQQQLAAREQEIARLQEQLKPAAAQEPKGLEATLTIVMGETPDGMYFANPEGVIGGGFRIAAGKLVGLHLVNRGARTHELMMGQKPGAMPGQMHGYAVNLFHEVAADIFVYPAGTKIEVGGSRFAEIEVGPGADLWIRTTFPAELKGEWEMGCFVHESNERSHYEQGMKARLLIE